MPITLEEKPEIYNEVELIELSSRIESESSVLNRDYTLAWTDATLEIFADKQIMCAEMSVKILEKLDRIINLELINKIIKDNPTMDRSQIENEYLEIKKKKKDYGKEIKDLLVLDVTTKMVFTRSRDGRVLKAAITKKEKSYEDEEEKKTVSGLKKLFKKKEPQREEAE